MQGPRRLASLFAHNDGSPVDLVTHGEGGLVALAFAASKPHLMDKYVANWVALGLLWVPCMY